MTPIASNLVVDALKWRYATKRFDRAKKIPDELWGALEQALVLTPSSMGIQPWKFVVLRDDAAREKLVPASFGQRQIADCSHLVVFALRRNIDTEHIERHLQRVLELRGGQPEALEGYRRSIADSTREAREAGRLEQWMSHQVYIALGQFMAAAAMMGVDTCPMEGLEPAKYDEILGLGPQGYTTLCACAAGYRAPGDKYATAAKVRFKTADVVSYV
ncbi:MAG TPA: NAD(P)H-dependent oxidoreductase [Opitutaceae bacterium]|jgi:nitroreductase|nr:NAD(P)H-dependent oxidoreductase [Opitutaceae bacterium]